MSRLHNRYIRKLEDYVAGYMSILEGIFGPRDQRFVFGNIGKSTRPAERPRPRTHFPDGFHFDGGCRVDIHITEYPWNHLCPDQGPWQVAHECVHLLDPTKRGGSNILEEGIATWFQNEPMHHPKNVRKKVRRYIDNNDRTTPEYEEAEELIRSCLPDILGAIKELRVSGVRIGDIEAEILQPRLPNAKDQLIERLCADFEG